LVIALRDKAGLAWGAVDFCVGYSGNGDMMHFDMRTTSIGQAYTRDATDSDGSNSYLESIHPNFQRAVLDKKVTQIRAKRSKKSVPKKDKESSFGFERNLLMRELESVSRDFFEPPVVPVQDAYSGLHLQMGDSDTKRIFEGRKRTDIPGNPVRQLQTDLKSVGIGLIGKPDGGFGFDTECAVREFQIYATMPQIAHQPQGAMRKILQKSRGLLADPIYGEDFWDVPNTDKYTGEVNGVANDEVRRLLQKWKDNSWRIPVIVQAWTIKNGDRDKIFNKKGNIWKYNEVTAGAPRMYVKDLSGYYTFPAGKDPNSVVIGDGAAGGPEVRDANHSWNETEFVTEDIFGGLALSALTPGQQSTFKIIRTIANAEANGGFLDRINGWDSEFISYGPYHWTLKVGEFPSFLAFLKARAPAAFRKAVGFFGVDITHNDTIRTPVCRSNHDWNGDGQCFFMSGSQRKFAYGRFKIFRGTAQKTLDPLDRNWGNYFRSWHFFYRFVMAARTIPEFRRLTYDFARMRVRHVMDIPINNFGFLDAAGNRVDPTIGEIFRSEKSFAMVLRIHVFRPAWIGNVSNQGNTLNRILRNAMNRIGNYNFSAWTQREERILIEEMLNFADYPEPARVADVQATLAGVNNFNYKNLPNGTLSEQRNFVFDDAGIPRIAY
jgi:hypothetical protein